MCCMDCVSYSVDSQTSSEVIPRDSVNTAGSSGSNFKVKQGHSGQMLADNEQNKPRYPITCRVVFFFNA